MNDVYKIGRTTNVKDRIRELSGFLPYKLTLIHWFWVEDAVTVERNLHGCFKLQRLGGEWFRLTSENLDHIRALYPPSREDFDTAFIERQHGARCGCRNCWSKRQLVVRLNESRKRIRASGRRCEGRKPYGSRAGEAAVIWRMQQLRAEGKSLENIATTLDAEQLKPRHAARWNPMTVSRILRAVAKPIMQN